MNDCHKKAQKAQKYSGSVLFVPLRGSFILSSILRPDQYLAGRRQLTNSRQCVTLGAFYNPTKFSAVQIEKASRTAAGEAQRTLPLQTVVDGDEALSELVELLSHRQAR